VKLAAEIIVVILFFALPVAAVFIRRRTRLGR
jgi:hypothetical protein